MRTPSKKPEVPLPTYNQFLSERRVYVARLIDQERRSIHRRIHRLLREESRKITDTEEILSTSMRRIDRIIEDDRLVAQSDAQVIALVNAVIDRTILEKARVARRLISREVKAAHLKAAYEKNSVQVDNDLLVKIGQQISDPIDREIVLLRARDQSFGSIAQHLNMEPEAARKRWSRIRNRVREFMKESDVT